MTQAFAFLEKDLEEDITPIIGLTTECADCDPDNPSAVDRNDCTTCLGSGRTEIALASIVGQIKESRLELLVGSKEGCRNTSSDDDYIDPEDCI